jgi:hypothetical protein
MKIEKTEKPEKPDENDLASAIVRLADKIGTSQSQLADTLSQLQANAKPDQMGFDDPRYQAQMRSEGFYAALPRPVYQNAFAVEPRGLSQDTIDKLMAIPSGKYLHGVVSVTVDEKGRIFLRYPAATIEDRMNFSRVVKDFPDLVDQLYAEAQLLQPA